MKTAAEVLRRHEQQAEADRHKSVTVIAAQGRVTVELDIVADEDDPYATLSARDPAGAELASVRVRPNFKLSTQTASAWIDDGFRRPD